MHHALSQHDNAAGPSQSVPGCRRVAKTPHFTTFQTSIVPWCKIPTGTNTPPMTISQPGASSSAQQQHQLQPLVGVWGEQRGAGSRPTNEHQQVCKTRVLPLLPTLIKERQVRSTGKPMTGALMYVERHHQGVCLPTDEGTRGTTAPNTNSTMLVHSCKSVQQWRREF